MNTSKIIADLRNNKNWTQTDLANESKVSRVMIGKYERSEAIPSIEAAKKIADAFEVSLDYLVGEGQNAQFDKQTLNRLQQIENLDSEIKEKMWFFIDTVLRDSQARKAYAS